MKEVKESNYVGADNFLTLYYSKKQAKTIVGDLRKEKLELRRVNDILRASKLEPAPIYDPGVRDRLVKCIKGEEVSPVMLFSLVKGLLIVDGYHRISMCYHLDPFMEIPSKLV